MRCPIGPILTSAAMRAAEAACADAGTSLATLMDRAGWAVAEAVWRFGGGRPVLILCGPGNNGGDGYVAARLLHMQGLHVRVAALGAPATELAKAARANWAGPVEQLADAAPAPVLVDALFGTGLTRSLPDDVAAHLARLGAAASFTLAVDLPSGVGADDGQVRGGSRAAMTLALGALKPAHLLMPSAAMCGTIRVADIGIDTVSNVSVLEKPHMAAPGPDAHKYRRGMVVVRGGAMAGAALLAARGAMPLAGYVVLCGARRPGPDALIHRRWADVADDTRVGAVLLGPGLGRDDAARSALAETLKSPHPLVLDADALHALAEAGAHVLMDCRRPVILTPHAGEFATLFPGLDGNRIEAAKAAAARSCATVVLKGADTVIAAPDGRAAVSPAAPGWLASAGTGDVLAGLCAARLAATGDGFRAACEAVWLHGEAARLAGPALIADDLPGHVPGAVAACL